MFGYCFIQKPSFNISTDRVDDIFESISKHIDITQKWQINIVFVSWEEIQKFNKQYRKKDTVTDVLSFHYHDDFSKLTPEDIAGELIFCEEKVVSQWEEYGLGSEKEFYNLLIHSLLHILGFDHEDKSDYEEMKKWEEVIWREVITDKNF